MAEKTKGVVLRQIRYGESSVICKIFTREFGLKSFMMKGAIRKKSGKQSILQPFTPVEISFRNRESSSLQYLSEIQRSFPLKSIPFDVRKSTVCIFLDEVLYRTLSEDYVNHELFDFVDQFIQLLDFTSNPSNYHLYFLLRLTRFYGFYPQGEGEGSFFDLTEGQFVKKPVGNPTLEESTSQSLQLLMTIQPSEMDDLQLNSTNRQALLKGLLEYFSLHLDQWKPIKSLDVFETIFH